ncbi:hypothetical protein T552_01172 [Pneumocystis carinii B80]|uniref:Large ribosomal subunit protein mL46 n=1 Tax=Pneumocystis carinii (strain B80) TaxID=1408658 RepID=A0A0W4ZLG8_PNEC8|nr:hypothetical protein T552_01172 [Pneumocystis carinii B80]KTW29216.1 hypothetical protein T552_01172 [Pneumocystis carinii B80]
MILFLISRNGRFFSSFCRVFGENNIDKIACNFVPEVEQEPPRLYRILAATVLLRSPVITEEKTPFEKAYYAYQRQLNERLAAPFPVDFYFKKGSSAERKWLDNEANKAKTKSVSDDIYSELQDKKADIGLPRETEADRQGDLRSLERKLDKTLYLLVKKPREEHCWQFPQGVVTDDDFLHTAAQRSLYEFCGNNMNVWYVGHVPIGNGKYKYPKGYSDKFYGAKIFFIKARIMAGHVKLDGKTVVDWLWVTKNEIKQYVSKSYWNFIQAML